MNSLRRFCGSGDTKQTVHLIGYRMRRYTEDIVKMLMWVTE